MRLLIPARAAVLAATLCSAQASGGPEAAPLKLHQGENETYRLSLDTLKRAFQAYRNVLETVAQQPGLLERIRAEAACLPESEAAGRDKLSLLMSRMERTEPALAAAFRKAGTSPKEAGMAMEVLARSMIIYGIIENTTENERYSSNKNVAFIKNNKKTISAMLSEFAASGKRFSALIEGTQEPDEEPGGEEPGK